MFFFFRASIYDHYCGITRSNRLVSRHFQSTNAEKTIKFQIENTAGLKRQNVEQNKRDDEQNRKKKKKKKKKKKEKKGEKKKNKKKKKKRQKRGKNKKTKKRRGKISKIWVTSLGRQIGRRLSCRRGFFCWLVCHGQCRRRQ